MLKSPLMMSSNLVRRNGINALRTFSSTSTVSKNVVLVDGARIPFALSSTIYKDYMAVDLQKMAFKGILVKSALDPKEIDCVISGNVIQEVKTANIAREAAIGAGIPDSVQAMTVVQACISSNLAICTAAEKILAGKADVVLCGGTESFSDVPIRFTRPMRQALIGAPKVAKKGPLAILQHFTKIGMKNIFGMETPAIANYTTGEVMGNSSDRLAARFGVTRKEQDEFAIMSHTRAAKAHEDGLYKDEIIPVDGNTMENGIRGDISYEKISKLNPAFVKPHGTHTAANSSFLTDGASATIIMSEEKALELGFTPKAYIRNWEFVAVDPFEDLLLGPTYATAKVLKGMGKTMKDMDVIEIHEAFAGQVLANINAMKDEKFGKEELGFGGAVGEVPYDKLNLLGGSLSVGHPFGATGNRIVTTAANRLIRENGKFALLTACADGGLAHACVLEQYPQK